jgi:hypothetical protein
MVARRLGKRRQRRQHCGRQDRTQDFLHDDQPPGINDKGLIRTDGTE